jgi:hypothetical protein
MLTFVDRLLAYLVSRGPCMFGPMHSVLERRASTHLVWFVVGKRSRSAIWMFEDVRKCACWRIKAPAVQCSGGWRGGDLLLQSLAVESCGLDPLSIHVSRFTTCVCQGTAHEIARLEIEEYGHSHDYHDYITFEALCVPS